MVPLITWIHPKENAHLSVCSNACHWTHGGLESTWHTKATQYVFVKHTKERQRWNRPPDTRSLLSNHVTGLCVDTASDEGIVETHTQLCIWHPGSATSRQMRCRSPVPHHLPLCWFLTKWEPRVDDVVTGSRTPAGTLVTRGTWEGCGGCHPQTGQDCTALTAAQPPRRDCHHWRAEQCSEAVTLLLAPSLSLSLHSPWLN